MKERIQTSRSPTRCPYCHDDLKVSKDIVACAQCGARHHRSCHSEHGRCATCGDDEALYPQNKPDRRDPLIGSRIQVERQDGQTHFQWAAGNPSDWVLIVLLCLLMPPLGIYFLFKRARHKNRTIILSPETIDLPIIRWDGFVTGQTRIPRHELGTIRVVSHFGASLLAIDHGIHRYKLSTGNLTPSLTPPELEWLADQINAWKDEG